MEWNAGVYFLYVFGGVNKVDISFKIAIGETAEHAVIREVQEELDVTPKIVRPLWLNQAFFTEDVDNLNYHELCIYFLMDVEKGKNLIESTENAEAMWVLPSGEKIYSSNFNKYETKEQKH